MYLDDIHLIKDSRFNIVYHIPSSTLKIVNDSAYKVFSLLKEGQSMEIFGDKKKMCELFLIHSLILLLKTMLIQKALGKSIINTSVELLFMFQTIAT